VTAKSLFWLPTRLVCGMIDRHRIITEYDGPVTVGESTSYCIGMPIEPPL
jgi:hypothetical protein